MLMGFNDFNPRLREGGDSSFNDLSSFGIYISIHASEKEATAREKGLVRSEDFNPRLREGGDKYFLTPTSFDHNFNPRLREGGDFHVDNLVRLETRFQSTPPRRRRLPSPLQGRSARNFNPRLREGGDTIWCFIFINFFLFQSTPPRRRRRC